MTQLFFGKNNWSCKVRWLFRFDWILDFELDFRIVLFLSNNGELDFDTGQNSLHDMQFKKKMLYPFFSSLNDTSAYFLSIFSQLIYIYNIMLMVWCGYDLCSDSRFNQIYFQFSNSFRFYSFFFCLVKFKFASHNKEIMTVRITFEINFCFRSFIFLYLIHSFFVSYKNTQ